MNLFDQTEKDKARQIAAGVHIDAVIKPVAVTPTVARLQDVKLDHEYVKYPPLGELFPEANPTAAELLFASISSFACKLGSMFAVPQTASGDKPTVAPCTRPMPKAPKLKLSSSS